MKNKIFYLYVFFALCSSAGVCSFADDSSSAVDAHSSYLNDLNKLITSSSDSIKEVNDNIEEQAIIKRNQEREEKARKYYEEGEELASEGKLDEARQYFEKAIHITEHPERVDHVKEDQSRVKAQEAALNALAKQGQTQVDQNENPVAAGTAATKENETLHQQDEEKKHRDEIKRLEDEVYSQAVDLYKDQKYAEARKKFEEVSLVIPDYKATKRYLDRIDRIFQKEQERVAQEQRRAAEAKERQHKLDVQDQAQSLYSAAIALFDNKNMDDALVKFNQVEVLSPDFKSTRSYIARIGQAVLDQKRQAEERQKQLAASQNQAQADEQRQKEMAEDREKAQELNAKNDETETIYAQALSSYRDRQFEAAKDGFLKVKDRDANYKDTEYYLDKVDNKIKQAQADEQRQKELTEERQREQDLKAKNDETEKIYAQALSLYRDRQFDAAKDEFLKVKDRDANYRSTQYYLGKIDNKLKEAQADQQRQKELAEERQRAQALQDKADQIQKIYDQAVGLYNNHQLDDSKVQFEAVEQLSPDFKSTRRYLHKIEILIAKAESDKRGVFVPFDTVPTAVVTAPVAMPPQPVESTVPVVTPPPAAAVVPAPPIPVTPPVPPPPPIPVAPIVVQTPAPVVEVPAPKPIDIPTPVPAPAVSLEDQQKQEQDITELSERSAQLYKQIAGISDDKYTGQTKRKMAEVDDILNSLKQSKERALRQIREDQARQQQEERKAEAQKMYQEGIEFVRTQDYSKAKIKFLEVENTIPDYRSTRHYLSRIEDYQKQSGVEAVTTHEKLEAEHLKLLQDKEDAGEARQAQEEQEKQDKMAQDQQTDLENLAQKASAINDDIIRLSKAQDYDAMKVKFTELENTVTALKVLKDQISKEKDHQGQTKQILRESMDHRHEISSQERQAMRQMYAYDNQQPKENRLLLSKQPADSDVLRHREVLREENDLFNEGVDRYEHKKYTQAKLLFGELADQHDPRAEAWLKKVDRAITQELLKSQEAEERERTAFIADQVKAQRELIVIQERERERQKKLTEEMERQKRLYEDDRLLQLRKEETMKAQERERQRQEEKRKQIEQEKEKQQEMYRFHKIEVVKPQPVTTVAPVVTVPSPVVPAVSATQLLAQKEQERQAKIKAEQDARQKRIEEQQEENERQQALMTEREKERQAKLKADADAKEARAQAQAEKLAQEQKRKQEVLRQQEEQREEKIKQEQILREENQRKEDFERQERQRQAELESQRQLVRKQLEDGVESLYQEALSLYKQGDYSAAADRFKDIQDILPGYKRSGQYMDEARSKSMSVKSQEVVTSDAPTTPVSRQDNISKALDLFDPNAK